MPLPNNGPDWLGVESKRADELYKSGKKVNNPSAQKANKPEIKVLPNRTLKGWRCRLDYQQRFDELAAREKHVSGKKGPDLIEEALELLFKKYDNMLT